MTKTRKWITGLAVSVALGLTTIIPAKADDAPVRALIILTSPSLQTQGMAMVLGNAIQAGGTPVDVLLCDTAGDLALKSTQSETLKPQNVTPEQLMGKLMQGGAKVSVCALYLPNSPHDQADLRDGITVATPPAMAAQMTAAGSRVYAF
ncbi:MAG: hypothetical protein ABID63_08420 [Pseudomonadota bacterium]